MIYSFGMTSLKPPVAHGSASIQ